MDEMKMVAEFRDKVPAIEADAAQEARRRLRAEAAGPSRSREPRPWVWRSAAVAGLTAALVVGVTVAQNVGGDHEPGGPARPGVLPGLPVAQAEVARIARQARTAAEANPGAPLTPGTWTYVKDTIREGDGAAIGPRSKQTTRETWYTADGTRRADVGDDGKVRERVPAADGPVDALGPGSVPKPAFLIGAPADPAGMRARVYAEVDRIIAMRERGELRSITGIDPSGGRDQVAFELIAQVLRAYYVPPRQEAALYGTLAYVKGVRVLAESRDALGRRGQAFYVTDPQSIRHEIIFDPVSYRYLGSRNIFTRDYVEKAPPPGVEGDYDPADPLRMKKGAVVGWTAKPASGVVAKPGGRPA
ncbi:CU044_5270 family protein [Spirillospora sp. NPDC127200]